ncbi:MAG: substrate-binding domain-containing protein [Chitinophagales bacterium]|nr:substrate-binding domain-containing protein [Chitinophagales bacterium]
MLEIGKILLCCTFQLILFSACKRESTHLTQNDTPASGDIHIVADESFAPLLRTEASTFIKIYKDAKVNISFLPEIDVVKAFFSDETIRLMIIARQLTGQEKEYFIKMGLPPREIKLAIDAIALIINSQNVDSNLQYQQVVDILSGKITSWKQINKDSPLENIVLVFDNQKSSTVRYLSDKVLQGGQLSPSAFAVDSNRAVINYVKQDPSAIGVIGASWISDTTDSVTQDILKGITTIAVSSPGKAEIFYLPVKRYIYSMQYPFLRELYIISQEKHSGLGTGFATYLASDEGQRIIQRSGLMPIDNAVRIIELKESF